MPDFKATDQKECVAVIGSGISGLSSAYILARNGYKVTLYEKNDYLGGHTLTDTTVNPPVDLGFMVFNYKNYPHLTGFFDQLQVDSEESDMSFSVSIDSGRLEWASHSLDTVFCQKKNLLSHRYWVMIFDVIRFSRQADSILAMTEEEGLTVSEYLERNRYSKEFLHHYLLPMSAAIWSAPNSAVMNFPIQTLVQFFHNHCMLDPFGSRPCWRVLKQRGHSYVAKVADYLKSSKLGEIKTSCAIVSVEASGSGDDVKVTEKDGTCRQFQKVIFACHPDQTLKILGEGASEAEKEILGDIKYQSNDIYLHSDENLMPKLKKSWASWNVINDCDAKADQNKSVFVSYWLNRLQNLGETPSGHRFCTLNPSFKPKEETVIRHLTLAHPLLTKAAVMAQKRVPSIQGKRNLYFCGAWNSYGFHEDGIKSAVAVCKMLNAPVPWVPRSLSPDMTLVQSHCIKSFDLLASTCIKRGSLRLILPNGHEKFYGNPKYKSALREDSKEETHATLFVKDFDFFKKVISTADIGLGEAWMNHDFETVACDTKRDPKRFGAPCDPNTESLLIRKSDELTALIELAILNNQNEMMWKSMKGSSLLTSIGSVASWIYHKSRANTITGSKRNISESYDLSNELFQILLSPSWMYSSAVYKTGDETIEEAQRYKLDLIIAKAGIKQGDHVLEIGCGWGEFAIRAAKTKNCRVTGVTISQEQLKLAQQRVKEAGVDHLVEIIEIDYRNITPPDQGFDAIVSIEMLEAVGQEYLKVYHETLNRLLKPTGKAVIQVITTPEWRYESYKNRLSSDFIARYIFPGSHLPSVKACKDACENTDLVLEDAEDIGLSYAPTLRDWRIRLLKNKSEIQNLRQANNTKDLFDERFIRMYEFYFAYCEAAFQTQYIGDHQLVWRKDAKAKKCEVKAAASKAARARGRATLGSLTLAITLGALGHLVLKASRRTP
mmetsp:Transcript_25180/g.35111  ORF Transcript_25180/g.35111 Transcript_25180/m.35111 type:complete len:947 (-) Transcript_25180:384-3224(-)|eukprot:CAMPEP_0184479328 /NCGR_PEP_ID=MMETSP0113_2-20130426/1092_1 /TAXON_ID=91329 /ORGANISM="Norrisiella sphaerica, Strain BC52" /LENGTH=946 /DNA_ID=CAMNT_0026857387 /DNA_START=143 /DNA_END=2983 /DNA_ORIENTATION=+